MIHSLYIVIHTIALIFYHCMSIGDIYIPNTQLMNSVEGEPVSQYYQGGQANTSMDSANHTAQQQIFDFYWGLNPYLHMVRPATQFAREITGWIADFVYGVDTFLQTLYVNLFALMDIKSTYNPTSSFWTILHWGQSLGIVACILATIIYFGMIIIMPKSDLFEKLRILFQQIIIGTAVIGIFPNVANGFASGLEYAANVLIGNGSRGAGGSGKTMGSMTDDIFRYNVVSVPHKITTFGLNPNGTPINSSGSSSSDSKSSSGSKSSSSTQGQQPDSNANNTENVIHVPESGNRIRYRPKSTFFNPDTSEQNTAEGQQIYAHEIMINLNAMGEEEANGWNGLWDESIPSFLHEYESDDSILNPSEDDSKRDAALKGKADRYDNDVEAAAEDPAKRNQLINQCIKDGEGGHGTCRAKYPRTSFGAGLRRHADDFFENIGTHPLESGGGLKGAFGGGTTTISPANLANKLINHLTITAHAVHVGDAKEMAGDKRRMRLGKKSEGNTDSKDPAKHAKEGKATGTKSDAQEDQSQSQGSLGIFGYELNGTDDYAAIDQIQEGFFSKHAGGATTAFYDKYKVQWFDIFTGLVLLAWIFIAFIAKLIGAFFKVSVMYATLGIFIYKAVSAPQAWKVFIKSFFGIYEMLLMDLIVIRLWFIIYMIVNNAIDAIVFHAVGADANGAVAGLVQFACDVVTATMAIKGVGAIDKILGPGANSGAQDSWGHALTAMSLLRGGAGLASLGYHGGKGAIHLGAKGGKMLGHGAKGIGHGIKNGAKALAGHGGVTPTPKHKSKGPIGRLHQAAHNFATRNNSAYEKDVNGNNVPKKHIANSANNSPSTPNSQSNKKHTPKHKAPKGNSNAHSRMSRLHGKHGQGSNNTPKSKTPKGNPKAHNRMNRLHGGRTGATTADNAITSKPNNNSNSNKSSNPEKRSNSNKGNKNLNTRKGTSKKQRKQRPNRKSKRNRRAGRPHFKHSNPSSSTSPTGSSNNSSQSDNDDSNTENQNNIPSDSTNDIPSDNSDNSSNQASTNQAGIPQDSNYVDSSSGLNDGSIADDYGNNKGLQAESTDFGKHGTTSDTGTPMDTYTLGNQHSHEGNTQSRTGDNNGDGRVTMFVPHKQSKNNSTTPQGNNTTPTSHLNPSHNRSHKASTAIPLRHHINDDTSATNSGSRVQRNNQHKPTSNNHNNSHGNRQVQSQRHINSTPTQNSGSNVQEQNPNNRPNQSNHQQHPTHRITPNTQSQRAGKRHIQSQATPQHNQQQHKPTTTQQQPNKQTQGNLNSTTSVSNSGSNVKPNNEHKTTPTNSANDGTSSTTQQQDSQDSTQGANDTTDNTSTTQSASAGNNENSNNADSNNNNNSTQPTTNGNLDSNNIQTNGSNPIPSTSNSNPSSINRNNNNTPQNRRIHQNANQNINREHRVQGNSGNNINRSNTNGSNGRTIVDRNVNRHINNTNDVENNGSNVIGNSGNNGNQQTIVRNHVHDINNNHNIQHNNNSTNAQQASNTPNTHTVTQTNEHTTSTNQTNSTTGNNNTANSIPNQNTLSTPQSIPNISANNVSSNNTPSTNVGNLGNSNSNTTGSNPTTRTISQNIDRNINHHNASTINRQQPTTNNNMTQRVVVNRNINRHINNDNDVNVNNVGGGFTGTTRQQTVVHNRYHDIVNNRTNQHINNTPSTTGSSPTINDTSLENTFDKSINNLGKSSVLGTTGSNPQPTNNQPTTQTHNVNNNITRNIQHTNNINNGTSGNDNLSSGMFRDMLGGEDNNQPTHFSNLTPHDNTTGSSHLDNSNNNSGSTPDFSSMLHHDDN